MKISLEEIDQMAEWVKLSLNKEEKKRYLDQLNRILDNIRIIEDFDSSSIGNIYGDSTGSFFKTPIQANLLREDMVQPSMDPVLLLKNAPNILDNMFDVPKVLE